MAGLNVNLDIGGKVSALAGAWTEFSDRDFARALQFSLTGVGIDAVNRWRRVVPDIFDHPTDWFSQGVRYDVDKAALASIATADQAAATVYAMPGQSSVLKYALGETHRAPGDVGMEGWFPDQGQIYLPVETNLAKTQGIRPNTFGNYSGAQVKRLAAQMAAGYTRNTTAKGKWGVFEIKAGDRDPARLGVGIHARPARGKAVDHRERLKRKLSTGKATAPRTEFTAAGGRQVDVPKVVNLDIPRLIFITRQEGVEYEAFATPSWEEVMTRAAETLPDRMANELVDKLEHATRKALRGH